MPVSNRHLIIIAGEVSGDQHGAHLVKALTALNPSLSFSGLGGDKMQQAGVELYTNMLKFSVIGFVEVLKHYSEFKKIFRQTLREIQQRRPAAVILIDYPGFNLRLAREIKKMGIKVIYYISPQVWAWKESRVRIIRKNVDQMLVLFPFEKDFYTRHRINAEFVGNPLIDDVHATRSAAETLQTYGCSANRRTIGLLPGSRTKEIELLLPVMLEAAAVVHKDDPDIQFILMQAPGISSRLIERYTVPHPNLPLTIIRNDTHNAIAACDVCIVASGTATLETALLGKPLVIIYKTSMITWLLARLLIKIPHIGLANIVAGKKVVPECLQYQASGRNIASELKNIYQNPTRIKEIQTEWKQLREKLGKPGAAQRAARLILQALV